MFKVPGRFVFVYPVYHICVASFLVDTNLDIFEFNWMKIYLKVTHCCFGKLNHNKVTQVSHFDSSIMFIWW